MTDAIAVPTPRRARMARWTSTPRRSPVPRSGIRRPKKGTRSRMRKDARPGQMPIGGRRLSDAWPGWSSAFSSVRSFRVRRVAFSRNRAPRTPRAMTTRSHLAVLRRRRARQESEKNGDWKSAGSTHCASRQPRTRRPTAAARDRASRWFQAGRVEPLSRPAPPKSLLRERGVRLPARGGRGKSAVCRGAKIVCDGRLCNRNALVRRLAGRRQVISLFRMLPDAKLVTRSLAVDVRGCQTTTRFRAPPRSASARREELAPLDGPRGRLAGGDRVASGG